MPLAEPVPVLDLVVRRGQARTVTVWHVWQVQGCWLAQRLLVLGEAALGSTSALAACGHRSDGIKMLVLILQRQLWDINRRCFAGKKENDNTLYQNYYSTVPWSQQSKSCEGGFLVCFFFPNKESFNGT